MSAPSLSERAYNAHWQHAANAPAPPNSYVEYLEEQQQLLVRALKKSYLKSVSGPASAPEPSINQILTETGVLAEAAAGPLSAPDLPFEEDLEALRARLEDETDYPSSSASLAETSGPTGTVASSPEPSLPDRLAFFRPSATPQPNSAPHTPQIPAPASADTRMTDISHAPTWPQPQSYFSPSGASAPASTSYWNPRMQGSVAGRSMLGLDTRSSTPGGGVARAASQPSRQPSQQPQQQQQQSPFQQQQQNWSAMGWNPRAGPGPAGYGYDPQNMPQPFTVSPSELQLEHIPEDFPFPEDPTLRGWFPESRE